MRIQDYFFTGLIFVPVCLGVFLSLASAYAKPPPEKRTHCNVIFSVREAEPPNMPIEAAKVTLDSRVKYTDEYGTADFGYYPIGSKHKYRVEKPGYKTEEGVITVPDADRYAVNIFLKKA